VTNASGKKLFEKRRPAGDGENNDLLADIFTWIEDYLAGDRLAAVGHRIVRGGRVFSGPVVIADRTLAALEKLVPLAPLHRKRDRNLSIVVSDESGAEIHREQVYTAG